MLPHNRGGGRALSRQRLIRLATQAGLRQCTEVNRADYLASSAPRQLRHSLSFFVFGFFKHLLFLRRLESLAGSNSKAGPIFCLVLWKSTPNAGKLPKGSCSPGVHLAHMEMGCPPFTAWNLD